MRKNSVILKLRAALAYPTFPINLWVFPNPRGLISRDSCLQLATRNSLMMRHTIDDGYPASVQRDATHLLPHSAYNLKKSQTFSHYKHLLDVCNKSPFKTAERTALYGQHLASLSDVVTGARPWETSSLEGLSFTFVLIASSTTRWRELKTQGCSSNHVFWRSTCSKWSIISTLFEIQRIWHQLPARLGTDSSKLGWKWSISSRKIFIKKPAIIKKPLSSKNHFHQKTTFIKKPLSCKKPLSSKNHFHHKTTLHQKTSGRSKNQFHQKPLSCTKTTFIKKPLSSKNQFHQSHPKP